MLDCFAMLHAVGKILNRSAEVASNVLFVILNGTEFQVFEGILDRLAGNTVHGCKNGERRAYALQKAIQEGLGTVCHDASH